MNFAKFLRTPFYRTPQWLLLKIKQNSCFFLNKTNVTLKRYFFLFLFLLIKKKYDELVKFSGILTCGRAKMPPRPLALAAGTITYHSFHHKSLVRPENKIEKGSQLTRYRSNFSQRDKMHLVMLHGQFSTER